MTGSSTPACGTAEPVAAITRSSGVQEGMCDGLKRNHDRGAMPRLAHRLGRALAGACVAAALAGGGIAAHAAECGLMPAARIPAIPTSLLNIDDVKRALKNYQSTFYEDDIAAVADSARKYIEQRAGQVTKPALVLDIDETSLSNWTNLVANDFGFIANGSCSRLPEGPCGFNEWILRSDASAIVPTLKLFRTALDKGVAVFFITARRDSQRQATLWNLDRAGYEGWARLITRGDRNDDDVQQFKTKQREKVAAAGYTIIANMGDQLSDLEGGFAECAFKVPNPFYTVP